MHNNIDISLREVCQDVLVPPQLNAPFCVTQCTRDLCLAPRCKVHIRRTVCFVHLLLMRYH